MRILLISNGNGEVAIAQRIAVAIRVFEPEALLEHLALVGTPSSTDELSVVGPTAAMPSGGLIAMFNLRNIFADLASGLIGLTLRQRQFLRAARGRYDLVISIGDVYALLMAGILRTRTIFVGTAKSVSVARYGAGELRLMRRAAYCFVRDEATAQDCRARGLPNVEAANAIVDLHDVDRIVDIVLPTAMQLVMLFPGSRASAYNEASLLCEVFAEARARNVVMLGALAVAPRLDRMKFVETLAKNGWHYDERGEYGAPWIVRGDACILLWTEQVGGLLAYTSLVLGQAGTANEAAAASGIAVAALDDGQTRADRWYRMRQKALLGDAMTILPRDAKSAGIQLAQLLEDRERRELMGAVGRARMGEPGGARRIAQRAVLCASET